MPQRRRYSKEQALALFTALDEGDSGGEEGGDTGAITEIALDQDSDEENSVDSGLDRPVVTATSTPVNSSNEPATSSIISRNGIQWTKVNLGPQAGRVAAQNIFRATPGPTAAATCTIKEGSPASALNLFLNERIMRHIQRCTELEGKCVFGSNWSVRIDELETFFLCYLRSVLGMKNMPWHNLWSDK